MMPHVSYVIKIAIFPEYNYTFLSLFVVLKH